MYMYTSILFVYAYIYTYIHISIYTYIHIYYMHVYTSIHSEGRLERLLPAAEHEVDHALGACGGLGVLEVVDDALRPVGAADGRLRVGGLPCYECKGLDIRLLFVDYVNIYI